MGGACRRMSKMATGKSAMPSTAPPIEFHDGLHGKFRPARLLPTGYLDESDYQSEYMTGVIA